MIRTSLLFTLVLFPSAMMGAEFPPTDHAGADLTLADGDVMWGTHSNVGTLTIPLGAKVTVKSYDGTNASTQVNTETGTLSISADHILIEGELSAEGAGYSGGGGGGGGGSYGFSGGEPGYGRYERNLWGNLLRGNGGSSSQSGCGLGCGPNSTFPGGLSMSGDGFDYGSFSSPFDEWWKSCGGYMSGSRTGTNEDQTLDESIIMGSGGAGSFGGTGGLLAGGHDAGDGGAGGGSGGGAIALIGRLSLRLGADSVVSADGTMAMARNVSPPVTGLQGRDGQSALPFDPNNQIDTDNWLTSGGSGAGGGILLKCDSLHGFVLEPGATITNLGGSDMVQNGGTVKIFYYQNRPSEDGVTILTGRKFVTGRASSASAGWSMYE